MKLTPALALCAALAAPALAQTQSDAGAPTAMTEAERQDFRAEVRAYLLENPEVLMEAIAILEDRQAAAEEANDAALVEANRAAIFDDPASWSGGNPQGDITVVEFMDYRCGYCRKAFEEVEALVKSDGKIRFVVKEFPILGEASDTSSRFAIATLQLAGPDAYKRAHDALVTLRGDVTPAALDRLAGDLGLDAAAIRARMIAPEVTAVIAQNRALAEALKINGTPTFVIDGVMLRGYVPLDGMRQIVEEARRG